MSVSEHSLKVDRKAVVSEQFCSFGRHRLSSGVGYVLLGEDGKEYVAGKDCAHRYGREADFPPVDLTKAKVLEPQAPSGDTPKPAAKASHTHHGVTRAEQERRRAEEYLVLYGVELPRLGFSLPEQPQIRAALDARKNGTLDNEALRPVWKLMQTMDRRGEPSPLSLPVLEASYLAASLLDRCLHKASGGTSFLSGLRHDLVEKRWLSPLQVIRLNENVARIDRKPLKLDPESFRRVRPAWQARQSFADD